MSRISILDLEQRTDAVTELEKLLQFLNNEPHHSNGSQDSFVDLMNYKINLLPYTGTSQNFSQYWHERTIRLFATNNSEATILILHLISFYRTYISWVVSNDQNKNLIYGRYNNINENFTFKINNIINYLLPLLNYKIEYEEKNKYGFKTPLIIKRDVDVDSALHLINDSDTRLDLLSYLDFRLENNLQAKQDILVRLYKTIIDDGKDTYSSPAKTDDFRLKYQNELYERIKQIYNKTDIRHGGSGKVELTEEEKLKYYDMCFYLLLQLIRTPKSIEDMREIKQVFNPQK